MFSDNPLVLTILNELRQSDESLSLYKLIKILEKQGYVLADQEVDESSQMMLFRKNFVVMNALYQLKLNLIDSGFNLFISSLKIQLIPELNIDTLAPAVRSSDVQADAALSDYYLNWDNFYLTDEQGVEKLLSGFWNCFTKYHQSHHVDDKRLDSLQVLGLESSASWKDIQQAYRQLITVYHPDKGGDSLKFIKIREAFLILKLTRT